MLSGKVSLALSWITACSNHWCNSMTDDIHWDDKHVLITTEGVSKPEQDVLMAVL